MKKLIIVSAIAISGLFYNTANAQISFHLGIHLWPHHIYVQPAIDVQSAPVEYANDDQANYDANDDYYYLPDVGAYYSADQQCYYYFDGDNWISAAYLPGYQNYDWRNARHYEVRAPRPYLHDDMYRARFHGAQGNWAHYANNYNRDDHNYNAYNGQQHFDNQHFDNRGQGGYAQANYMNNRDEGQQYAQNQNRGRENDGRQFANQDQSRQMDNHQPRFAQNNRGYDGHNRNRF